MKIPVVNVVQVSGHERRPSQLEALNDMPLYPTEEIIWDEHVVPMEYFATECKCHLTIGYNLFSIHI